MLSDLAGLDKVMANCYSSQNNAYFSSSSSFPRPTEIILRSRLENLLIKLSWLKLGKLPIIFVLKMFAVSASERII